MPHLSLKFHETDTRGQRTQRRNCALQQFIPFFTPLRFYGSTPVFGETPWDTFSGGTKIATGLEAARVALRRAHITCGSILLVSDLDDSNADDGSKPE